MNYVVFVALVLALFAGTFWVLTRAFERRRPDQPGESSTATVTGDTGADRSSAPTDSRRSDDHSLTQPLGDDFVCRLLDVTDAGLRVAVTDGDDTAVFLVTGYDDHAGTATVEPDPAAAAPRDGGQPVYGAFPGPVGYTAAGGTAGPADADEQAAGDEDGGEDDWTPAAREALETGFDPVFDVRDFLPASDPPRVQALRDRFDHAHVDTYPEGDLLEVTDRDRLVRVLVPDEGPPRLTEAGSTSDDTTDPWLADALEYADAVDLSPTDEPEPITE
ncbi:hypothetical protein [Haloarchaeobius amylolyticus]|uniref:hypothetical protein n=1 Tax=Haloarchaeobius amylolyticus TaxID=1198296 RepID=UPI0022703745|nr:hypothetical protein [Haloarchaeobius amylolyticus]